MTETTTQIERSPETVMSSQIRPADILLNLIVLILAPIFLTAAEGNIAFARMAAVETIEAYRARNPVDLIAIAQIIVGGLAALGSLSLSMTEDLPVAMILRLRSNANALNRVVERNRRAIKEARLETSEAEGAEGVAFNPEDATYEAEVIASVAVTQKLAAETQARSTATEPPAAEPPATQPASAEPASNLAPALARAPALSPTTAPKPGATAQPIAATVPMQARAIPPMTNRERQMVWGRGMAEVAAEYTASLPGLPPIERRNASLRAAVLSSTANALLCGTLPEEPKPWSAIARPK